MAERDELRKSREQNLAELRSLGLPALPNRYGPTRSAEEIKNQYQALEGSRVRAAGRLMRTRVMGKAAFAHIQDRSGQIQLYFKLDLLGDEKYRYFKLLDLGDIIGVQGTVFKTKTGEVSLHVEDCVLLAKAYLQLPEKWHGLTDVEARYRQRYLDLISNEDTRRIFWLRSKALRAIRTYLDKRGFQEVETPVLQPLYGGAAATPFTTRYEAVDADVYLRIATELYLKRLIIGGLDRVYEIGKDFRNEGLSRKNSPEFSMLELYQAYADYQDIMALTEDLISQVAQDVLGSTKVAAGEEEVDLAPPWRRMTVREAIAEHNGRELEGVMKREDLLDIAGAKGVEVDRDSSYGQLADDIVARLIEPELIQPTILYDYPVDFPGSLLAKRKQDEPDIVERFEAYAGGIEVVNAFTEENDPEEQRRRMEAARAEMGKEEHHEIDRDFLMALEHGMPPTGGLGVGIDRLMMVLAGVRHIRETILFPFLRTKEADDAES